MNLSPRLDFRKPLQTRDGEKVTIVCSTGKPPFPIIGYVESYPRAICWTKDGYHNADKTILHNLDLVEVPLFKSLNGVKYPAPEIIQPIEGTPIFVPDLVFHSHVYSGTYSDSWSSVFQQNLIHLSHANALAHYNAIVKAGKASGHV